MSEKQPDTPVVHLPWSHYQAITARLDALEAAVFRAKRQPEESPSDRAIRGVKDGFAQRLAEAAPPPPAAAPDVNERVRMALSDALDCLAPEGYVPVFGKPKTDALREALRLLGARP